MVDNGRPCLTLLVTTTTLTTGASFFFFFFFFSVKVCARVEVTDTLDSTSPPDNQQTQPRRLPQEDKGAQQVAATITTKDIRRTQVLQQGRPRT
jgi:hypothetical protein